MDRRFIRMSETFITFVFLALMFAAFTCCLEQQTTTPKPDPCSSYTVASDPFLDVSFTTPTNNFSTVYGGWYRHLNYGQGVMAMECPTGTQCGTSSPIWMNDTLPSYADGIVTVAVCYKNSTHCCGSPGTVRVKNCKTFFVYFLLLQATSGVRWCFDKSLTPLELEAASGPNIGLIAGAAAGGTFIVALGIVAAILGVRYKKIKTNPTGPSEPEANTVENDKSSKKP